MSCSDPTVSDAPGQHPLSPTYRDVLVLCELRSLLPVIKPMLATVHLGLHLFRPRRIISEVVAQLSTRAEPDCEKGFRHACNASDRHEDVNNDKRQVRPSGQCNCQPGKKVALVKIVVRWLE